MEQQTVLASLSLLSCSESTGAALRLQEDDLSGASESMRGPPALPYNINLPGLFVSRCAVLSRSHQSWSSG